MVNHCENAWQISSKVGLCNSLKNLCWWSETPVDDFFPRCYDLTLGVEVNEFKEDFRITKAESILRTYLQTKEVPEKTNLYIAMDVLEKKINEDIDTPEAIFTDEMFDEMINP